MDITIKYLHDVNYILTVLTTSTVPTTKATGLCTEVEGMQNPALIPNIKVNGTEDTLGLLRPGQNKLIVKDSVVQIEIDLGKPIQLGSFKFVSPETSNIKTFNIFLVKNTGETPEQYEKTKV